MSVEIDLLKRALDMLLSDDVSSPAFKSVVCDIQRYLDKQAAKSDDSTPCCQAPILHFRSTSKKVCADCGQEFDWHLKNGQMPLIKHTR